MSQRVFRTDVKINGSTVPLVIQRMTVDQWLAFRTEFRHMTERAERCASAKAGAGDDASFEASLARETENDVLATTFTRNAIVAYVSVAPYADVRDEDGCPVQTGADVFEAYGRDVGAISTVLAAIFTEHALTANQKKALRLAHASGSGSAALTLEPSGDKPEPIAENAEPSIFAASADVMVSASEDASSGRTDL